MLWQNHHLIDLRAHEIRILMKSYISRKIHYVPQFTTDATTLFVELIGMDVRVCIQYTYVFASGGLWRKRARRYVRTKIFCGLNNSCCKRAYPCDHLSVAKSHWQQCSACCEHLVIIVRDCPDALTLLRMSLLMEYLVVSVCPRSWRCSWCWLVPWISSGSQRWAQKKEDTNSFCGRHKNDVAPWAK